MTGDADDENDDGLSESVEDEDAGNGTGPFSRLAQLSATSDRYEGAKRAQMRMQYMGRMADQVEESMKQLADLAERLEQYQEEVREAVESTIDLDVPWEYDPDESTVQERAERVARNQLLHLLEELDDVDDPYLRMIQHRTYIGLEAYIGTVRDEEGERVDIEPRPHEAIFLFISLQDGLMHWLCEQDEDTDWDEQHGSRNEYYSSTKKERLKEAYVSSHGLASDSVFENNLDAFYHHRNYVMHSNPGTRFDMNIATAAALFFMLTLHTVREELEDAE